MWIQNHRAQAVYGRFCVEAPPEGILFFNFTYALERFAQTQSVHMPNNIHTDLLSATITHLSVSFYSLCVPNISSYYNDYYTVSYIIFLLLREPYLFLVFNRCILMHSFSLTKRSYLLSWHHMNWRRDERCPVRHSSFLLLSEPGSCTRVQYHDDHRSI